MKLSKLLLATVGATVLLGALVGSASAREITISSQTLRALFTSVTFAGAVSWVCELQLEGSLHSRTIRKVLGTLLGYITAARILRCAENTATILTETLPWHAQYGGFSGTLPRITDIRLNIIGVRFQVQEPAFTCLATSTAARPVFGTFNVEAAGAITTGSISGTVPTSCFFDGSFASNNAPVTVLNAATRITVRLI